MYFVTQSFHRCFLTHLYILTEELIYIYIDERNVSFRFDNFFLSWSRKAVCNKGWIQDFCEWRGGRAPWPPPPHLLIIVHCCAEEIAFWDRIRPLCDMLKEEFFLLFKKPSQAAQTTSALKSSLVKIWLKYCLGRVQDNNIVVQAKLPEIFGDLNATYMKIESRIKAEAYKQRVMACFRAWEVSHCFVPLSIFLGI